MTITAEEIIYKYCEGRMFPDPEYYAGHGNDPRDLNSSILEMIYKGVQAEIGPAQAKAFVNMVKNLKDTNAKNFLLDFYRMEKKGWRYGDPVLKVRVAPAKVDAPASADAVVLPPKPQVPIKRITEVLNAFKREASSVGHDKAITADFLAAHKAEIDSSLINSSFGGGGI